MVEVLSDLWTANDATRLQQRVQQNVLSIDLFPILFDSIVMDA